MERSEVFDFAEVDDGRARGTTGTSCCGFEFGREVLFLTNRSPPGGCDVAMENPLLLVVFHVEQRGTLSREPAGERVRCTIVELAVVDLSDVATAE